MNTDELQALVQKKLADHKKAADGITYETNQTTVDGVTEEGTTYEVKTAGVKVGSDLITNTTELAEKIASQFMGGDKDLFCACVDTVLMNKAAGVMGHQEFPLNDPQQILKVAAEMADTIKTAKEAE